MPHSCCGKLSYSKGCCSKGLWQSAREAAAFRCKGRCNKVHSSDDAARGPGHHGGAVRGNIRVEMLQQGIVWCY
jgi:hypothetical protein